MPLIISLLIPIEAVRLYFIFLMCIAKEYMRFAGFIGVYDLNSSNKCIFLKGKNVLHDFPWVGKGST